jgi:hypothetical protein
MYENFPNAVWGYVASCFFFAFKNMSQLKLILICLRQANTSCWLSICTNNQNSFYTLKSKTTHRFGVSNKEKLNTIPHHASITRKSYTREYIIPTGVEVFVFYAPPGRLRVGQDDFGGRRFEFVAGQDISDGTAAGRTAGADGATACPSPSSCGPASFTRAHSSNRVEQQQ